jgi:hypothetical protein
MPPSDSDAAPHRGAPALSAFGEERDANRAGHRPHPFAGQAQGTRPMDRCRRAPGPQARCRSAPPNRPLSTLGKAMLHAMPAMRALVQPTMIIGSPLVSPNKPHERPTPIQAPLLQPSPRGTSTLAGAPGARTSRLSRDARSRCLSASLMRTGAFPSKGPADVGIIELEVPRDFHCVRILFAPKSSHPDLGSGDREDEIVHPCPRLHAS